MQASDYIRASDCAQSMTKWCREQGFTFAVQPPGSKGHPFLIVNANGGRVKVPFSMTPSETRRAPLNAVRELKRALRERGLWPVTPDDQAEADADDAEEAATVHATGDGCPLPPPTARRKRDGSLAGGYQTPEVKEYFHRRKKFVAKRLLAGDSHEEIADAICATGVTFRASSIMPLTTELRATGLIPQEFSYNPAKTPQANAAPEPATEPASPAQDAPEPQHAKLPAQLNGSFGDLVYMALKDARAKSASDADSLAAVWIEKIAEGRKRAEMDVISGEIENRYLRVLDALTQ